MPHTPSHRAYVAFLLSVCAITTLNGCTSVLHSDLVVKCVQSDKDRDGSAAESKLPICPQGLAYSLPKARVLLTASRHQATSPDPATQLSTIQGKIKDAAATVSKDRDAVTAAQKTLADDTAKHEAAAKLESDKAAVDAAKAKQTTDQAAVDALNAAYPKITTYFGHQTDAAKARAQLNKDLADVAQRRQRLEDDSRIPNIAPAQIAADKAALAQAESQRDTETGILNQGLSVLAEDLAAARAQLGDAAVTVAKDGDGITSAQKQLDDDTAAKKADPVLASDKAKLAAATAKQQADQTAVDAAQLLLTAAQTGVPTWTETAALSLLPISPDPAARYVANISHEITRDDTQKFSVVNGLLTSSTVTSTDQTPNLIIAIADTAITLATLGGGAIHPSPASQVSAASTNCNYDTAVTFDPLDQNELDAAQNVLRAHNSNIGLTIYTGVTPVSTGKKLISTTDGLVYRIATPVVVAATVSETSMDKAGMCPLGALPAAQTMVGIIPDSRSDFVIGATAGAFTTTNYSFGFSSGMLTDYSVQRPSELAAIANIPVRIATDIVQIPTSLIQLKVNYDTQATALVNAQTALQQAQLARPAALLSTQTALVNAQTTLTQAQLAQPAAVATGQTAIVNAQTGLAQAQIGQSTAISTAKSALVNAESNLQQAKLAQPTAVVSAQTALVNAQTAYQNAQSQQGISGVDAQTALIQAHAALLQAEAALQAAMAAQGSTPQ
jgi:hypothetical protein